MALQNKYINNPYGANVQGTTPPQQPLQPQQSQADVNDMLGIAMETDEGKKAYQEWLVQRDIALSRIAREVPEGATAYNNFEMKIKDIYNNVLLQTVKNKSNKSETDELKNKNNELEEQMAKMQAQLDKLSEVKPNDKSTNK